jgi:hypothetical protein
MDFFLEQSNNARYLLLLLRPARGFEFDSCKTVRV